MKINQAQQIFGVVIISSGLSISADIVGCLSKQEAFSVLDICRNAVTGLKTITSRRPDLVFIVAPLPDRMVTYVIKEAKRRQPHARIILVADWTEFAGFARANQKGADGFISTNLLPKELPLVLAQYSSLRSTWGTQFSPWKARYGMA